MSEDTKRYFAVVLPERKLGLNALLVSGSERDGKMLMAKGYIGFALDYYPEEKRGCELEYNKAIIGDYASRAEAEDAIRVRFSS